MSRVDRPVTKYLQILVKLFLSFYFSESSEEEEENWNDTRTLSILITISHHSKHCESQSLFSQSCPIVCNILILILVNSYNKISIRMLLFRLCVKWLTVVG